MSSASRPVFAWIALALAGSHALAAPSAYPPKANKPHPQLILPNLKHDKVIPITSYRGKKVLLIHLASWSENCRKELPEWNEKTKALIAADKLVVIGVSQEQSPERSRLLLQWLKIDWPVLHDPLNTHEVRKLPTVIAIDEHGYVQDPHAKIETFESKFVNQTYPKPGKPAYYERDVLQDPRVTRRIVEDTNAAEDWNRHGTSIILSWRPALLPEGVESFTKLTGKEPKSAVAYFRLGVAHLFRRASEFAQGDDLEGAQKALKKAAALSSSNEVFAQRLLVASGKDTGEKWIKLARKEIKARGEKPVALPKGNKPSATSAPTKKPKTSKSAPKS
jgi:peroxiredoxin